MCACAIRHDDDEPPRRRRLRRRRHSPFYSFLSHFLSSVDSVDNGRAVRRSDDTGAGEGRPSKTVFVAVFLSIKWKIDQDIFGREKRRPTRAAPRRAPLLFDLAAVKIAAFDLPSFSLFLPLLQGESICCKELKHPVAVPVSASPVPSHFYLAFLGLEIALLGLVADSAISIPTHLPQLSVTVYVSVLLPGTSVLISIIY